MASKASLQTKGRRYSPVAHYILWMVRRYGWVMLPALAVDLLFAFILKSASRRNDVDVFCLINADSILPLRWAVVLFGLLTAFLLFGYLWNRRETNCYGAIGISRTKQFLIRYLWGLVLNFLPIILSLITAYMVDIKNITADPYGVCGHYTLIFILSLCLIAWLSYSVCTIVAVLCGRLLSASVCAMAVLAAPYVVVHTVQMLMNAFLLGAPGGALISGEFISSDHPFELNLMRGYGQKTGLFTMLPDELGAIRILGHPATSLSDREYATRYLEARPLPVVHFLLLAALALLLGAVALWLFRRRKAENAGQLYLHPVLSHVAALLCGAGAASLCLRIAIPVERDAALWLKGLLFLGVLFAVTLLVCLILCREWRGLLRSLPVAGGAVAAALITAVCFVSGGFGYATTVPDADEVASVTVSYNQNHMPYYNIGGSSSSSGMWMGDWMLESVSMHKYNIHYYSGFDVRWEDLPTCTEPEDIETVRRIHQAIIEDGLRPYTAREADEYADTAVRVNYCISYTLKSGKVINRYYENLSLRVLEATLAIDGTDALHDLMESMHSELRFPGSVLVFTDPLFAAVRTPELSSEEKATLLSLLDADYADLSVEKRYFPSAEEILGTIYLSMYAESEPSEEAKVLEPISHDSEIYYLTADYTRTLAYLAEHDLAQYLTPTSYTVKDVLVQPYTPRTGNNRERGITYLFRSYPNLNQLDGKHVDLVTSLPESEWEEVIAASVPTAMLTRPGRMIFIVMENANGQDLAMTRFVPDP